MADMNISTLPAARSEVLPQGGSSVLPVFGKTPAAAPVNNAPAARQDLSTEQIQKIVQDLREQLVSMNIEVNFSRYGDNNERVAVIVSDKNTGEVIREIPPEELQNLYLKMNELIGMLLNGAA